MMIVGIVFLGIVSLAFVALFLKFFGLWFITSLEIEKERLFVSGEPRKLAFSISSAKDI